MSARPWELSEDIDFHIKSVTDPDDGHVWLWLRCSACGNVQATTEGEGTDLGTLVVVAQSHFERRHG